MPRPEISIVRSMKRSALTPHLASATLFLAFAATGLLAQEKMTAPAPKPAPTKSSQRMAELMKRFDQDGDGMLDDAERAAAKEALMREPIEPRSTSAASASDGPEGFARRMLEMFDKNQDGRLDEAERAAAKKFAAERGLGNRGEMREEVMNRFDKNGDGRLDPDEREAAQNYFRERMEKASAATSPKASDPAALEKVLRSAIEGNAAQLRRFDADKNGKLEDKEWAAARREIQRWANDGPEASAAGSSPQPAVEQERKRLETVAAEVARRREAREQAAKKSRK
jgi:Ca2+-binding EF-hand superfamily protein